ncbi:Tautomerase/MIF superfamily [Cytidiella melzeri]|nr:Tautomerase/MIF superfamily [Cytidiella melzeri]
MPSLELKTNVKIADPKAFLVEFSKLAAETLNKPESYITVSYSYNEYMAWEGTFDPTYLLNIVSLGNVNPEVNITYSKTFSEFLQAKIGAPANRGYISIIDPGVDNLGHVTSYL